MKDLVPDDTVVEVVFEVVVFREAHEVDLLHVNEVFLFGSSDLDHY